MAEKRKSKDQEYSRSEKVKPEDENRLIFPLEPGDYQSLLNNLLEGCQVIDKTWHYVFINETAARHGRHPQDYYVGHTMMDLYPGIEDTPLFTKLRTCMQKRIPQSFLNEFIYPDSTKGWFELRIQPIPEGIFILSIDVSERKILENNLKEDERKLVTLLSNLPGVAYRCLNDPIWTMEYLSEGCLALTGYTQDVLIGENAIPFHKLIFPDDKAYVWDSIQNAILANKPYTLEYRLIAKNGTVKWVWEQGRAVEKDATGSIHLEGFITDISEQHEVKENLSRSELTSRLFIDHAPSALAMFDKNMCYLIASERWKHDFGLSDQSIIGKSHYDLFPELPERIKASHRQALSGEKLHKEEDQFIRADGSVQWLTWEALPWYTADHEVGGIVIMSEEITKRKEAEIELKKSVARFQTLVEQIPAITYIAALDENSTTLYISPQVEYYLGYSPDDYKSNPDIWLERLHPDDRERVLQETYENRANQRQLISEYRMLSKNGQIVWFRDEAKLVYDAEGQPMFLQGLMMDITEQKKNERELEQYISQVESLLEIEDAISSTLDLDRVLEFIIEKITSVVKCDYISVKNLDHDMLNVVAFRGKGISNKKSDSRFPLIPESPDFLVIKETKPMRVTEMRTEFPQYYETLIADQIEIHSWLGVPLVYKGQKIGNIALGRAKADPFSTSEVKLVSSIANHAAFAIENAKLFSEANTRLERISSLHEIDLAISGSIDLEIVLNVLLDQVLSQLHVEAADILLLNPQSGMLEYKVGRGFYQNKIKQSAIRIGQGYSGKAALDHQVSFLPALASLEPPFPRMGLIDGENFISYFVAPLISKKKTVGVLEIFTRKTLAPNQEWRDFLDTICGQAAIAIESIQLFNNLQRSTDALRYAYDATIEGWSMAMDLRDKETEGHTLRVTDLTVRLAQKLGISDEEIIHIRRGALLHDIGKLGVPDAILFKADKLSPEEWELMRRHPQLAHDMLARIEYLRPALDIPYAHHEKWDGSGYPRGLKGEQIPFPARIFAVVDVWDALRSDRPYRKAWSSKRTRDYIQSQSGKHFDPQVVKAFIELISTKQDFS
jgi:PAS domain S-box-containing protein